MGEVRSPWGEKLPAQWLEWSEGITMKLTVVRDQAVDVLPADPVFELFEFWRVVMGHERAQLGPKRRQKIRAAFDIGYTLDDLKLAVVGCKYSPMHQGQNERNTIYDDIELIVRDEAHVDKFMRVGEQKIRLAMERERETADREQSKESAVSMPADVRAKLDAIFAKHKKPRSA
jgi:hypothetical protein